MFYLCPECKRKPQPPGLHRGQCQAKVSPECKAWTDDFVFTLCEPCGKHLELCVWCSGPIDGGSGAVVPTAKQFVRAFQNDSGKHITGMNVGEQVLVQLMVDLYSGYIWTYDRWASSSEVRLYGSRLIRDPQDWRHATLELYIDLNVANEKAKIVVSESSVGSWWTPPPSSKKWECTVEIRR